MLLFCQTFLDEEVVEASKVYYKLSDIQLPPGKPLSTFASVNVYEVPIGEPNTTEKNSASIPENSIKQEENMPVSRKRKSRWDTEEPIKQESDDKASHDDILASAIAAAKAAAQLAASGS